MNDSHLEIFEYPFEGKFFKPRPRGHGVDLTLMHGHIDQPLGRLCYQPPLHLSITSLLHPYGTVLLTRFRFRMDNSVSPPRLVLLTLTKPLQPLSQTLLIPRPRLRSAPAIRTPTSLSGFLNPNRPRVAVLSFLELKPTFSSISTFHRDLGTQFGYH